ncbi:hypothetical protein CDL15_Pgr028678 [Punica granatum]|nr:hypothetical protein CDL15_Pgr028678 [Punica granatum]
MGGVSFTLPFVGGVCLSCGYKWRWVTLQRLCLVGPEDALGSCEGSRTHFICPETSPQVECGDATWRAMFYQLSYD